MKKVPLLNEFLEFPMVSLIFVFLLAWTKHYMKFDQVSPTWASNKKWLASYISLIVNSYR